MPGLTTTQTTYDLLPASSITLDPSETYWLVVGITNGSESLETRITTNLTETGPGSIGNMILASGSMGATWSESLSAMDSAFKFSVEGTVVPEPGTIMLLVIGTFGLMVGRWRRWRTSG